MEENKAAIPAEVTTTDYKAELDKAKAELAKNQDELAKARFTLKKNNIESKKTAKVFAKEEEPEEDAPGMEEVIESKVREAVIANRAESYLSKHSMNESEIELARFHLENTIRPSGNPEVDALAALSVANQSTLRKQNAELKTALVNRSQMGSASQASGGGKVEVSEFSKHLTDEQISTLRVKHGMNDVQIKMFLEKRGSRTS